MEKDSEIKLEEQNFEGTGALAQATVAVKTKKKKKKKKKATAKEKALEKLDKASEEFLKNPNGTNDLLLSVAYWLELKQKVVYKLMNQQCLLTNEHEKVKKNRIFDEDDDEDPPDPEDDDEDDLNPEAFKITYDDFKLVSNDLDIPCANVELHAICKLLDPDDEGAIDYRTFTPALMKSHLRHKNIDGIRFITGTERTKNSINFCKEPTKHFATKYPLYIKLDLKLISFANDKEYVGHIKNEMVYSHMKIYSLIELIKQRTDLACMKIYLYQDASLSKASLLDENKTLEAYGFKSGDYNDIFNGTDKVILYYDYKTYGVIDPIIHCDFYFHNFKYTPGLKTNK